MALFMSVPWLHIGLHKAVAVDSFFRYGWFPSNQLVSRGKIIDANQISFARKA
jgi:hypothetical protein